MVATLDDIVELLSTKDVKSRLKGVSDLEEYLHADPEPEEDDFDFDRILDVVMPVLSDNNPRVCQGVLTALLILLDQFGPSFRSHFHIIPQVAEKLGDSKIPVRDKAMDVLLELMGSFSTKEIFDKLDFAVRHKNWRVKEQYLACFSLSLSRFGPASLPMLDYLPNIVKLLEDSKADVREASVQAIVDVYKHVGDPLRNDLAQRGLRSAIMKAIFDRFDELGPVSPTYMENGTAGGAKHANGGSSGKPFGTRRPFSDNTPLPQHSSHNSGSKPPAHYGAGGGGGQQQRATGPGGAVLRRGNSDASDGSFGSMGSSGSLNLKMCEPVKVYSEKDLEKELEDIRVNLADNKGKEWDTRVGAMRKIQGLLVGGAADFDCFVAMLKMLKGPLSEQLNDLRSAVVKEACATISALSKSLGDSFEPFVEAYIPSLLKLTYTTIQVMSESGDQCLRNVIMHTKAPKIVPRFCKEVQGKGNGVLKAKCMQFLQLALESWPAEAHDKFLSTIMTALRSGLSDATSEVRAASRYCFWSFYSIDDNRGEKILSQLDGSAQKLLKEAESSYKNSLKSTTYKSRSRIGTTADVESLIGEQKENRPDFLHRGIDKGGVDHGDIRAPSGHSSSHNSIREHQQQQQREPLSVRRVREQPQQRQQPEYDDDHMNYRGSGSGGGGGGGAYGGGHQQPPAAFPPAPSRPRGISNGAVRVEVDRDGYSPAMNGHTRDRDVVSTPAASSGPKRVPRTSSSNGNGNGNGYAAGTPNDKPKRVPARAFVDPEENDGYQIEQQQHRYGGSVDVRERSVSAPSSSQHKASSASRVAVTGTPSGPGRVLGGAGRERERDNGTNDSGYAATNGHGSSGGPNRVPAASLDNGATGAVDSAPTDNGLGDILPLAKSQLWSTRVECFRSLKAFYHSDRSSEVVRDIEKIVKLYSDHIADPHYKVVQSCIESLKDFVSLYRTSVEQHLERLLPKLFIKLSDYKESTKQLAAAAIEVVKECYYADSLLPTLLKVSEQSNPKIRSAALDFIGSTAEGASPYFQKPHQMRYFLDKVVVHLGDRSSELKRATLNCLLAVYSYNAQVFISQLVLLPINSLTSVKRAMLPHIPDLETQINALSKGPAPPKRSNSSASFGSSGGRDTGGNGVGAANANGNVTIHSSGRNPSRGANGSHVMVVNVNGTGGESRPYSVSEPNPHEYSSRGDDPRLQRVQQQQEVRRNPPPTQQQGGSVDPRLVEREREREVQERMAVANGRVGPQTTGHHGTYNPKVYSTKQQQQQQGGGVSGGASNAKEWLAAVPRLMAELGNGTVAQKQDSLHKLIRMSRERDPNLWSYCFSQVVGDLMQIVRSDSIPIAEGCLALLKEILKNQAEVIDMDLYAGEMVANLVYLYRDHSVELNQVTDETIDMIIACSNPESSLDALVPLIQEVDVPTLQACIRTLSKLVQSMTAQTLVARVNSVLPGLFKSFKNPCADVRKAVVFCLVEMYLLLGDEFTPYLAELDSSQLKLVRIYIDRTVRARADRVRDEKN